MTDEYTVAFLRSALDDLRSELAREDGQEDLRFVLWKPGNGRQRLTAIIADSGLRPTTGDRHIHMNASFESRYFLRALAHASQTGSGLGLVHTHPEGHGWQRLSRQDWRAERSIAAQAHQVTGLPLVGITISGDGTPSARFWDRRKASEYRFEECPNVRVVGTQLGLSWRKRNGDGESNPRLIRSVAAWGAEAQQRLERLRVGVVGVGSVGSMVSEALVRMGISKVSLIDFDVVQEHNLDRVFNVFAGDIGTSKVEAVAPRLALSAVSKKSLDLRCVEFGVTEDEGFRSALDCDLLFSCVDRPWPRQVLNLLAYQYLIPVVDGGIAVRSTGLEIQGAEWRAHSIGPGRKCLQCLGQFRPEDVGLEREGFLDDPTYISGLPTRHLARRRENVFAFSMALSGLMLTEFLRLVVMPAAVADVGAQLYHLATGEIDRDTGDCDADCLYASTSVGMGDTGFKSTGNHHAAERARAERAERASSQAQADVRNAG